MVQAAIGQSDWCNQLHAVEIGQACKATILVQVIAYHRGVPPLGGPTHVPVAEKRLDWAILFTRGVSQVCRFDTELSWELGHAGHSRGRLARTPHETPFCNQLQHCNQLHDHRGRLRLPVFNSDST